MDVDRLVGGDEYILANEYPTHRQESRWPLIVLSAHSRAVQYEMKIPHLLGSIFNALLIATNSDTNESL